MVGFAVTPGSSASIVHEHVTSDFRYIVALTRGLPRHGAFVAMVLIEQWLHQEEETALACVQAVSDTHAACVAMGTPGSGTALTCMASSSMRHRELCERTDDRPAIGREIHALRGALFSDGV